MNGNLDSNFNSKTFTVFDQNNNLNFLVDSGSSMSLIPTYLSSRFDVCTPATQSVRMKYASGKTITSESEVFLHLKLNCGSFSWNFRVCNVRKCILGADFFHHFGLLVNVRAKTLVPDDSCVRKPCTPSTETVSLEEDNATNLAALKKGNTDKVTSETVKLVLEEFPKLTKPMSYDRPVKHDVTYTIETSGLPVSCRPRQLSPEMIKIAKKQFDDMLEKGIIEPSSGSWSSPLHLLKKKGWLIPLCGRLSPIE